MQNSLCFKRQIFLVSNFFLLMTVFNKLLTLLWNWKFCWPSKTQQYCIPDRFFCSPIDDSLAYDLKEILSPHILLFCVHCYSFHIECETSAFRPAVFSQSHTLEKLMWTASTICNIASQHAGLRRIPDTGRRSWTLQCCLLFEAL